MSDQTWHDLYWDVLTSNEDELRREFPHLFPDPTKCLPPEKLAAGQGGPGWTDEDLAHAAACAVCQRRLALGAELQRHTRPWLIPLQRGWARGRYELALTGDSSTSSRHLWAVTLPLSRQDQLHGRVQGFGRPAPAGPTLAIRLFFTGDQPRPAGDEDLLARFNGAVFEVRFQPEGLAEHSVRLTVAMDGEGNLVSGLAPVDLGANPAECQVDVKLVSQPGAPPEAASAPPFSAAAPSRDPAARD